MFKATVVYIQYIAHESIEVIIIAKYLSRTEKTKGNWNTVKDFANSGVARGRGQVGTYYPGRRPWGHISIFCSHLKTGIKADIYRLSMSLFCLSLSFVYLLYICRSWDKSKINKQGCSFARKGHGNVVIKTKICLKMLYFLENTGKSPQRWGLRPQILLAFGGGGLRIQTPNLLLKSFVLITLKLRPIISYLSDG